MMKKSNYYWILLSFTCIISSCYFNEDIAIDELERYPVYFQFEYINNPLDENHYGWFIDNQGNVIGYSQPEQWNLETNQGFYIENDLLGNIANIDTLLYSVNIEELQEQVAFIPSAQAGMLSDPQINNANIGTKALYAFLWNGEKEGYERILIQSIGDKVQDNNSEKAISIGNWLKDIGKEIYQDDDWFSL